VLRQSPVVTAAEPYRNGQVRRSFSGFIYVHNVWSLGLSTEELEAAADVGSDLAHLRLSKHEIATRLNDSPRVETSRQDMKRNFDHRGAGRFEWSYWLVLVGLSIGLAAGISAFIVAAEYML
jgi:hypothetical protein